MDYEDKYFEALKNNDYLVRREAIISLGNLRCKRAVEALIKVLKGDEIEDVRVVAIAVLVNIEDGERVVDVLIDRLENDDCVDVRVAAAEALGRIIRDERAIEPLIEALEDDDNGVRSAAAEALGINFYALMDIFENDDCVDVRVAAAEALGIIRDERAIEPLIEAFRDDNDRMRRAAEEALREIGGNMAVEPLIEALRQALAFDDIHALMPIIKTLGEIGDEKAGKSLIKALKNDNDRVRWAAEEALKEIGGKRAFEAMEDYYENW